MPGLYDYMASANCYKVRLLLAQLELPYERVAIDIFDGHTLTDDFARLNPHRSTPVLELEDGRTLIESNAILWYLALGIRFFPEDPVEQAEVVRWLIYEQADVMPAIGGLRFRLVTGRFAPDSPEAERRRRDAHEVLGILDEHLPRDRSSSASAIASPTSPCSATPMSRRRRESTSPATGTSSPGSTA
jgi:glutathione S-transferase